MLRFCGVMLLTLIAAADGLAQRAVPGREPGDRAKLEERFRARFEQVLKERLALSDAQLAQVVEVNRRLDGRRRELFMEERAVRKDMRDALQGGDDAATQDRVAQLVERALRVQRLRLELVESEQRELAAFLSPVQRAKYLGMQEQLRRRADEMRQRAEADPLSDSASAPAAPGMRRRPFMRRPGTPG